MSHEPKVQGLARVQVTLEIDCTQPWPPEAPLSQIFKQASGEAIDAVRRKIHPTEARIIGEPHVTAILACEYRN